MYIYIYYVYVYKYITYRHLYQRPAPRDCAYFVGPSIELAWRVVQAAESRKANENRYRCGVFLNFPWLEVHEIDSEHSVCFFCDFFWRIRDFGKGPWYCWSFRNPAPLKKVVHPIIYSCRFFFTSKRWLFWHFWTINSISAKGSWIPTSSRKSCWKTTNRKGNPYSFGKAAIEIWDHGTGTPWPACTFSPCAEVESLETKGAAEAWSAGYYCFVGIRYICNIAIGYTVVWTYIFLLESQLHHIILYLYLIYKNIHSLKLTVRPLKIGLFPQKEIHLPSNF